MGKPGETYNIGNDKPEISVKDLFKLLENIHDKKIFAKKVNYPESYPEDEPQRRCPDLTLIKKSVNRLFTSSLKYSQNLSGSFS